MKQFVIFGIGRFGESIATALYDMGHEVLVVDKTQDRVQYMSDTGYSCSSGRCNG